MTNQNPFNDIELAMYRMVHDFAPAGAETLAPLLGIRAHTLCNKVNPGQDGHHLSVEEALRIQRLRKMAGMADPCPLFLAEAREFGFITVPTPKLGDVADMDLLNAWARWHADIGETGSAIKEALADNRITRAELDKIRREMFEDFKCELELLQRLEALCDD